MDYASTVSTALGFDEAVDATRTVSRARTRYGGAGRRPVVQAA